VASWDEPLAEHATLCVDRIDGTGKATVSLLHRYERGTVMAGVRITIPGQPAASGKMARQVYSELTVEELNCLDRFIAEMN